MSVEYSRENVEEGAKEGPAAEKNGENADGDEADTVESGGGSDLSNGKPKRRSARKWSKARSQINLPHYVGTAAASTTHEVGASVSQRLNSCIGWGGKPQNPVDVVRSLLMQVRNVLRR